VDLEMTERNKRYSSS